MDDTYGVADGLEEEESEETADPSLSWRIGDTKREGTAPDGVDAQQKRRVEPVEHDDAQETEWRIVSGICACGRRWRCTHRPTVKVIWQYEKS